MPVSRALRRLDNSSPLLAVALVCALAPAAARAETDAGAAQAKLDGGTPHALPDGGAPQAELDAPRVDIEGERPRGSADAPAAASTVVDAARFSGEVRSVAELISTAPGVSVHATGGPGQSTTLSVRGATADESLVLLDGIPLVGPGGGAVDLSTVPAMLLERAVVSRGVLGAQLGAGALGGVVELVPRSSRGELTGGAQASYGSFRTAQVAADVSTSAGEAGALTAAIQLDRSAGDFTYAQQLTPDVPDSPSAYFARGNDDFKRGAGLVRWEKTAAAIAASALVQVSTGDRGLPGPVGGLTPDARATDAAWVAGARVQGLAGSSIWSLRAWARGSWLRLQGLGLLAGDCPPGEPGCAPAVNRSFGARVEAELRTPLGGTQTLSALLSGGGEGASGDGVGLHERAVVAAALADEIRLIDGRLALHPAVRFDETGDARGVSPGVAAVGRPFAEGSPLAPVELRSGFGWSFRAPTLAELYLDQGAVVPNADLRPERAWSADGGVAWRSGALDVSVGGFWTSYTDLILYEQFPPARIKPYNIGAARIAGLEARAVITLPLGFVVEASYSYLDAINRRPSATEGGQKLPYRPPHHLFARAARRGDRLEGYLEIDATSEMPRNAFGTATLPGRALVNAGLGVRAVASLWIDLEAKNLFDVETAQDLYGYPLPGFSLAAIARIRL